MRYSLKSLLLFLAYTATACGGLLWATSIWSQCIFFFTFLAILFTILLAVFAPKNKPYWVGLALASTAYFVLAVCPGGFDGLFPTTPLLVLVHGRMVAKSAPMSGATQYVTYAPGYTPAIAPSGWRSRGSVTVVPAYVPSDTPTVSVDATVPLEPTPADVTLAEPLPGDAPSLTPSPEGGELSPAAAPLDSDAAPVVSASPIPVPGPIYYPPGGPGSVVTVGPPASPMAAPYTSPYASPYSPQSFPYPGQAEALKFHDRLRIGHCVFAILLGLVVGEVTMRAVGHRTTVNSSPDGPSPA